MSSTQRIIKISKNSDEKMDNPNITYQFIEKTENLHCKSGQQTITLVINNNYMEEKGV